VVSLNLAHPVCKLQAFTCIFLLSGHWSLMHIRSCFFLTRAVQRVYWWLANGFKRLPCSCVLNWKLIYTQWHIRCSKLSRTSLCLHADVTTVDSTIQFIIQRRQSTSSVSSARHGWDFSRNEIWLSLSSRLLKSQLHASTNRPTGRSHQNNDLSYFLYRLTNSHLTLVFNKDENQTSLSVVKIKILMILSYFYYIHSLSPILRSRRLSVTFRQYHMPVTFHIAQSCVHEEL